jgi:hypothetical protein
MAYEVDCKQLKQDVSLHGKTQASREIENECKYIEPWKISMHL